MSNLIGETYVNKHKDNMGVMLQLLSNWVGEMGMKNHKN
jgi:hypothetical protein